MEVFSQYNFIDFINCLNDVRSKMSDWLIVEVALSDKNCACNPLSIIRRFQYTFIDKQVEGKIFIADQSSLLMLANAKTEVDKRVVHEALICPRANKCCNSSVIEPSEEALERIMDKMKVISDQLVPVKVCPIRKARVEKVIMVADDDVFMRSLVMKALSPYAKIVEVDKGLDIVEKYVYHLPDILFLDIHLPDANGIDILEKILKFDRDAYVVMLSADSNKHNVIDTNRMGAKGFVAKPFTGGKLLHFLEKCPTMNI